jgi:hypothetical protein
LFLFLFGKSKAQQRLFKYSCRDVRRSQLEWVLILSIKTNNNDRNVLKTHLTTTKHSWVYNDTKQTDGVRSEGKVFLYRKMPTSEYS